MKITFPAQIGLSLLHTLLKSVLSRPQIFTEDTPEVESLPRDQVLSHIEQNAPQLQIPYLVSTDVFFIFKC